MTDWLTAWPIWLLAWLTAWMNERTDGRTNTWRTRTLIIIQCTRPSDLSTLVEVPWHLSSTVCSTWSGSLSPDSGSCLSSPVPRRQGTVSGHSKVCPASHRASDTGTSRRPTSWSDPGIGWNGGVHASVCTLSKRTERLHSVMLLSVVDTWRSPNCSFMTSSYNRRSRSIFKIFPIAA